MKLKYSPSLMCADFLHLQEQLDVFAGHGFDLLHMDIMDGHFVPNFTFGPDLVKKVRAGMRIPMDFHFMTEHPETYLSLFAPQPGDYVSIHAEATDHIQRVLSSIRATGAKAMLAINPATPLTALDYVTDDIDGVLVMTVNPGFAGQAFIPAMLQKVADTRAYLDARGKQGVEIEVDGNISFTNAPLLRDSGANIFVLGTSSIFKGNLEEKIGAFRSVMEA